MMRVSFYFIELVFLVDFVKKTWKESKKVYKINHRSTNLTPPGTLHLQCMERVYKPKMVSYTPVVDCQLTLVLSVSKMNSFNSSTVTSFPTFSCSLVNQINTS